MRYISYHQGYYSTTLCHHTGPDQSRPSWQLVLQEEDQTYDPRLPQQRVVLEEAVDNWEVADHTTLLIPASLSRLHEGKVVYAGVLFIGELFIFI